MHRQPMWKGVVLCACLAGLVAARLPGAPHPQCAELPSATSLPVTGDPSLRITHEPSGTISLFEVGVEADFAAGGDTVIRSTDSDECVGRVNAFTPDAPAGQMLVDSPSLPSLLIINPDPTFFFYFGSVGAPPFVFPVGQRVEVTVETTGSSVNPAMPLRRLHSADDSFIDVFTPVIPNSGVLVVHSTQPLEVTWQRPTGHPEEPERNKLIVSLWFIAGLSLQGEVRCGFDLAKGRGVMPRSVLHEVKVRVDPVNPIPGAALRVLVGDRQEVRAGGVSYVIELGPLAGGTNIPVDNVTTVK